MLNLEGRTRRVDLEKMTDETIENVAIQLGDKIAKIIVEANTKANELLAIYGLETQIYALNFVPKGTLNPQSEE